MKVSIIVPVYNAEKYLARTFSALQAQTLSELEIILVDDGSTDASRSLCEQIVQEDKRFRCIHQANQGLSAARNAGMKAAKGEYLQFCDADDIPHPTQAEALFRKAKEEDADIVYCGFFWQRQGSFQKEIFPYRDAFTEQEQIREQLVMPLCVWGYAPEGRKYPAFHGSVCRGMYRSTFITDQSIVFPSGEQRAEDLVFNVHALSRCRKVSFVPECLYDYLENSASLVHTHYELLWRRYLNTWQSVHDLLMENGYSPRQLAWHNYQLKVLAVSAVQESVCGQPLSFPEKLRQTREILRTPTLLSAMRDLPSDLKTGTRLKTLLMKPALSMPALLYFQVTTQ